MRWRLFLLLGVFFVGFVGATVFPGDCDLDEKMIAYWRMENNLLDSYGSHDAGVWVGTGMYTPFAVGSGGALFDGSKSISISGVSDLDFQFAFTIEFLVNSDSSVDSVLFEKGGYKIEWVNIGF